MFFFSLDSFRLALFLLDVTAFYFARGIQFKTLLKEKTLFLNKTILLILLNSHYVLLLIIMPRNIGKNNEIKLMFTFQRNCSTIFVHFMILCIQLTKTFYIAYNLLVKSMF